MENEYNVINPDVAKSWNVKQHNKFLEADAEEEAKQGDEGSLEGPDFSAEVTLSAKKLNR